MRRKTEAFLFAREQMIKHKNVDAALGYCYAISEVRAARAELPRLRLVHG